MNRQWNVKKLGDIGFFSSGKIIKPGTVGRFKVFGSNGVIGGSDEVRFQTGIVVGRVGAYCGSVAISREPFWASDNTIIIEPNGETDLDYLYYRLQCANLNQHAGGAAQPLITQTTLKGLEFEFPERPIQIRISIILRSIDDLIENNRRRIGIFTIPPRFCGGFPQLV